MRLLWQAVVAFLVLFGLGFTALSLLHPNDNGDFGFTSQRIGPGTDRVMSVSAGGAAAAAGIRSGDTLQVAQSFHDRIVRQTTEPGDLLRVRVVGRPNWIDLVAAQVPANLPILAVVVIVVTRVAFLFMAGLIAWRRPDDGAARSLATFLALFGTSLTVGVDMGQFHPIALRFAADVLIESTYVLGAVAVLSFACRFPEPPRYGWRRIASRAVLPLAATTILLSWIRLPLIFFTDTPLSVERLLVFAYTILYALILVLALAVMATNFKSAQGSDRIRLRWVLLTFVVGFSGLVVYLVFVPFAPLNDLLQTFTLTLVAIPFGLAYVILRHRVIDIGFVINRAVVYTTVSLLIVGIFILFEWLAGHLVEQRSNAGLILNLVAALALGLSARFIHDRVDRWVDDLFFRDRHLAEEAIRRFAHEAALVTDPDDLVAKTVDVARRNARLTSVAFYAKQGKTYRALAAIPAVDGTVAPDVDEHDYAVLSMRTWHASVDVTQAGSALIGEIAFPMMVRGGLAGFLLCGSKTSHEALAPDERAALALLARDAGIALDSLRVRIIERELTALAQGGALPATLLERLSYLDSST
jgi:hypothetical protein